MLLRERGVSVGTDGSAKGRHIINSICLAMEVAFLQWMEGEKELPVRTHRFLTVFATCTKSPGVPVEKNNWR